jgi:hypothetical protein
MHEQQIVGEAVAGHSHEVRMKIKALVDQMSTDNFTLAELLFEVKSKQYYSGYGFNTFKEYAASVGVKPSRAYYLARIVEVMSATGFERKQYEPLGIVKLKEITKLEPGQQSPDGKFDHTSYIQQMVTEPDKFTTEDVISIVAEAQGKVGENKFVWWNVNMLWSVRENIIKPAIALAKKLVGTVDTDDDGMAKDASDGRALELICADFLSDPNHAEPANHDGDHQNEVTKVEPEQAQSTNAGTNTENPETDSWSV